MLNCEFFCDEAMFCTTDEVQVRNMNGGKFELIHQSSKCKHDFLSQMTVFSKQMTNNVFFLIFQMLDTWLYSLYQNDPQIAGMLASFCHFRHAYNRS